MDDGRRRTPDHGYMYTCTISSPLSLSAKSKREIIQSLIYRSLPNVFQVIYTLDTIYDSYYDHKLLLGYDK